MDEELRKELKKYARECADDVYDIDLEILMQLVIYGADWYHEQINKPLAKSEREDKNKNDGN